VGSANRDSAYYDNSEEFDLDRPAHHHLAFGTGPHVCLGMHLARMELRIALNAIVDGLPGLRLDPDAAPPVIGGLAFRGPQALPVLFDPTPSAQSA
jgi:cytochrome P450